MFLEASLIATFAQQALGRPSPNWLGHFAAPEPIRRTGLWNTQHLESIPICQERLTRFGELVDDTLEGQPR
jgi:hypothetical protein